MAAPSEHRDSVDADELIFKSSSGEPLSEEELAGVFSLLEYFLSDTPGRKPSPDTVYSCLLVLAKVRDARSKATLERFLEGTDPLTVSLVLETLCLQWGFVEDYIERVLSLCLGNSWDPDNDVQHTAITIAGTYLATFCPQIAIGGSQSKPTRLCRRVVGLLLSLLDDAGGETESRRAAFRALYCATNKDISRIPSEYEEWSEVERLIASEGKWLDQLREMSSSEGSSSPD